MFEDKLIKEVHKNECLWNKYNPDYKNKRKKDVCWNNVSTFVGEPEETCRKRWKSLRDRFVIELATRNKPNANPNRTNAKKEFQFFNQLLFLTATVAAKSELSNTMPDNRRHQNSKTTKDIGKEKGNAETESTTTTEISLPTLPSNNISSELQRNIGLDETIRTLVENYLNFVNTYKQSSDPFLAVIQEFFEKVPTHKRTSFKMDILNYTYRKFAELKD